MNKKDFEFNSVYGRFIFDELDKRFFAILFISLVFVLSMTRVAQYFEADFSGNDYFIKFAKNYSKVNLTLNESNFLDPSKEFNTSEKSLNTGFINERIDPRSKRDFSKLKDDLLKDQNDSGVLAVLSADNASYDALPEIESIDNNSISDVLAEKEKSLALYNAGVNARPHYANSSKDFFVDPKFDPLEYELKRQGNPYLEPTSEMLFEEEKQGYRDPNEIALVINKKQSMVEYCHRKEQRLTGNLEGSILVQFKIRYSGEIDPASVRILKSTLFNKRVEKCIKNTIRRWRGFESLDKSNGNVTIVQKFIFN